MTRIESLLRKEIGLDAASIGSNLIERTIRLRMRQHGLHHVEEYEALLQNSRNELANLTEEVVVTETWFFRDREPFNAFVQLFLGEWAPRHPHRPCRIISIPCSTGEEPYSLAMALLDVGVDPQHFSIEGVDISTKALGRAQQAIYGKNSFRGKDHTFRDRHFASTEAGYALKPEVRRCVAFRRDNLLDDGFRADQLAYDFIFCRNLLIYFDRTTQVLALAKLHQLLADDGCLFVGPAELPLVSESGFASANLPLAFACRKGGPQTTLPKPTRKRARPEDAIIPAPVLRPTRSETPAVHAGTAQPLTPSSDSLEMARQFADAGELAKATEVCEQYLQRNGPTPEAYYLLGLVKDASDDDNAITFYRKAIYLKPDHYEALIHIALWLEKHGDAAGARTFKRRAERAQPRIEVKP